VIECVPTDSVEVEKLAVPLDTVPVPSAVVPSLKVTVPVAPAESVAVNVTDAAAVDGFCEEATVTDGVPLLTIRVPFTKASE
jgi:hypothetical protein